MRGKFTAGLGILLALLLLLCACDSGTREQPAERAAEEQPSRLSELETPPEEPSASPPEMPSRPEPPTSTPTPPEEQEKPAPPETGEERQRLYAFGAYNGFYYDLGDRNISGVRWDEQEAVGALLAEEFDIVDNATAHEYLRWLEREGFAASSEEYFGNDELLLVAQGKIHPPMEMYEEDALFFAACYRVYADQLVGRFGFAEEELYEIDTTVAGDLDLLVAVARMCYAVGHLREDEVWSYLRQAEQEATTLYDSWEEYFLGVMFHSALLWCEEEFSEEEVSLLLLGEESPYQIFEFGSREGGARNNLGWDRVV